MINTTSRVIVHIFLFFIQSLKGEFWEYSSSLMCFVNGQLIGNEKDLKVWAEEHWDFIFFRPPALYLALAEDFYSSHLGNTKARLFQGPFCIKLAAIFGLPF